MELVSRVYVLNCLASYIDGYLRATVHMWLEIPIDGVH